MTTIHKATWVLDASSIDNEGRVSVNPRLKHRYHSEGWCREGAVVGLHVSAKQSYEGNPNNFVCRSCGKHFVRVEVDETTARKLRSFTEKAFDGTNGLASITDFAVSKCLYGCDCLTGYEHDQRECVEDEAVGWNGKLVVIPLVHTTVEFEVEDHASAPEEHGEEAFEQSDALPSIGGSYFAESES